MILPSGYQYASNMIATPGMGFTHTNHVGNGTCIFHVTIEDFNHQATQPLSVINHTRSRIYTRFLYESILYVLMTIR